MRKTRLLLEPSGRPAGPSRSVLSKNNQCPEDDEQRDRNTQQPENEHFPHDGLSFTPANPDLSHALAAETPLQPLASILCMAFTYGGCFKELGRPLDVWWGLDFGRAKERSAPTSLIILLRAPTRSPLRQGATGTYHPNGKALRNWSEDGDPDV
jgi:hypothetical protein